MGIVDDMGAWRVMVCEGGRSEEGHVVQLYSTPQPIRMNQSSISHACMWWRKWVNRGERA